MFIVAAIILNSLISSPTIPLSLKPVPVHAVDVNTVNRELLLKLVNQARSKGVTCKGVYHPPVPPLTWNALLEKAAYGHSSEMLKKNYFSHIAKDGSTANQRIERAGYKWMAYGENIGYGYYSEAEVVAAWLTSPGHCANIMSNNFKEMGVGRAGDYWTLDFAAK